MAMRTGHLPNQFIGKKSSCVHFNETSAINMTRQADNAKKVNAGDLIRASVVANFCNVICQTSKITDNQSFNPESETTGFSTTVCLTPAIPVVLTIKDIIVILKFLRIS